LGRWALDSCRKKRIVGEPAEGNYLKRKSTYKIGNSRKKRFFKTIFLETVWKNRELMKGNV
jgi:hypothetical protein